MAVSLIDYIESLHERGDPWPRPPAVDPPRTSTSIEPLPGIRAVLWNVYGTLIRIADGELLHDHSQRLRMQIAMEKTVEEFNMWNSMYRTAQQPWEYMYDRWTKALEESRLTASAPRKGDFPLRDSAKLWRRLIAELEKKEYTWDEDLAADADDLAVKVAYYFHARLQGVEASENALTTLAAVGASKVHQGLLAETQPFTLAQLLHRLAAQGTVPVLGELFDPKLLVQSHLFGCAKPSPTLYETAIERLGAIGIEPGETLVVGTRVASDLGPAKRHGFRTAIYAADKPAVHIRAKDVKDPATKPDRLLTDLAQIREILRIG